MISVFGGYNHNIRIGDGEFYDTENLTSSYYPVLSTRPSRGMFNASVSPSGLIAKDVLCYVDGSYFVHGENRVYLGIVDNGEQRILVSMGSYVIILPDKKYINTEDYADNGNIEAAKVTAGTVRLSLCNPEGITYGSMAVGPVAPASPENLAYWLDTSGKPHALKRYAAQTSSWVSVATTYVRIEAAGIGADFKEGDGITISGITAEGAKDLNTSMLVMARGDDYIVVTGILDEVVTQDTPITVSRRMPNMDFIIESGNRLWGCRYGTAVNGEFVNEIYACKLGDFKNWIVFAGISTDSYAATVGTDGEFTGAIAHMGYPLFFKEGCIHKVYGSYPANYQIQTTTCRGVQLGSHRSLAIVNEVLYYKSRSSVCAYDGSLPVDISEALGGVAYGGAVAGAIGNKYYVSMADESGTYHLFVYDTVRTIWHREDNTRVREFCAHRGELYYVDGFGRAIRTILGSGIPSDAVISWRAETGILCTDSPDKKYVSGLDVRMALDVRSMIDIYIQYDSCGEWEHVYTAIGESLQSFPVPIRPRRCDHMRLLFKGRGPATIFSICKTIEEGSDL